MAKLKFARAESKAKIELILAMVKAVPLTKYDISEMLPMSRRWVSDYLNHLHKHRRIFIYRWDKHIEQREKRHAVPVWAAGRREDAPKPPPDPKEVRYKRAWARVHSDPDRHEDMLAKRRVRRRIKAKRPDIAAAWVFPQKLGSSNVRQQEAAT